MDGSVDSTDALLIKSYLNGLTELSRMQLGIADVNLDRKVTHMDWLIILQYDTEMIARLPHPAANYGDVDLDGRVDSTDANRILSFVEDNDPGTIKDFANADVSSDALVTKMDAYIVLQKDTGLVQSLPVRATLYGDVNGDGQVLMYDSSLISQFKSTGDESLIKNFANSDVNRDGLVSMVDAYLIAQYVVGLIRRLPVQLSMYGDVDLNNKVDSTDALRVETFVQTHNTNDLPGLVNADVDIDGRITSNDAELILEFDTEKIDKLPTCPDTGCLFRPRFTVR